eukprot:8003655-Pyramimonas_sp.AAC.1
MRLTPTPSPNPDPNPNPNPNLFLTSGRLAIHLGTPISELVSNPAEVIAALNKNEKYKHFLIDEDDAAPHDEVKHNL